MHQVCEYLENRLYCLCNSPGSLNPRSSTYTVMYVSWLRFAATSRKANNRTRSSTVARADPAVIPLPATRHFEKHAPMRTDRISWYVAKERRSR